MTATRIRVIECGRTSLDYEMAVTGSLAPNQRPVIAKLGIRALLAGSLANLMSAALASLMLP